MIKVSVTNLQNVITNIGYFESQELVDQWILENSSNRAFGESEEYTISQEDITAEIQASRDLYSKVELGKAARQASRPGTAKSLISAITPDGILVTQEMKDACLSLLQDY